MEITPLSNPIRVTIAENDLLVREGMERLLTDHDDLALVGVTAEGEDVFPLVESYQPDVLILGGHLPQNDQPPLRPFAVVAAVKKLVRRYPDMAIILVARYYIPLVGQALVREKVRGFIFREDKLARALPTAVRAVHNGEQFFSETAREALFHPSNQKRVYRLNEQQVALLAALVANPGASHRQQARNLGLSAGGLDHHFRRLCQALGAQSQLGLVVRAMQLGILRAEELG